MLGVRKRRPASRIRSDLPSGGYRNRPPPNGKEAKGTASPIPPCASRFPRTVGGAGRCDRSYVVDHITPIIWPRCLCVVRRLPSGNPGGSGRWWPHNVASASDRMRPGPAPLERECAGHHTRPRPNRTAATGFSRQSVMLVMWPNKRRQSSSSRGRDRREHITAKTT